MTPKPNNATEETSVDLGYNRSFIELYEVVGELGKGGFGAVKKVKRKINNEIFACKQISKVLDAKVASIQTRMRHLENVQREVAVMKALKGSLNIVTFEGVYEDDDFVYIVMECCFGGELLHTIGLRPYSENTVIRIMRAVLRTLAQCHERGILHRDIKPGNFMFLKDDQNSPIKAIDFGLAVFSEGSGIPRTDLGFDGTPWFMAPEVLSSKVVPASDVWSAGVMAYQLLSGRLPFDDKTCRHAPALSAVWKSVLTDEPEFIKSCWKEVSQEAKDFIKLLLNKNPAERPTAVEALSHDWLTKDRKETAERSLSHTIVQRIQRFGQSSLLKRTVLDMIANELLQSYVEKTLYNAKKASAQLDQPVENSVPLLRGGVTERSQSKAIDILKGLRKPRGWQSYTDLSKLASFSVEDWQEARKASRLALDTSSHGSEAFSCFAENSYQDGCILSQEDVSFLNSKHIPESGIEKSLSTGANTLQAASEQDFRLDDIDQEERKWRGRSLYKDFIEAEGKSLSQEVIVETETSVPYPLDHKAIRIEQFMKIVFGVKDAEEVNKVMEFLNIGVSTNATEKELISGLAKLGYDVDENEISALLEIMSPGGNGVNFTQFVASQIDWDSIQENHKEKWLECVKHTFEAIDKDQDGKLSSSDLVAAIAEKLPNKEDIDSALDQARMEASVADLQMTFEDFLALLNEGSKASPLNRFDSRYNSSSTSQFEA